MEYSPNINVILRVITVTKLEDELIVITWCRIYLMILLFGIIILVRHN